MLSAEDSLESSFSIPVMSELAMEDRSLIANNPCGANIPCAVLPVFFAYDSDVAQRKTPVTGAERAIGARIREARERLGVSIDELGLATGSSRQKVQFWERGDHFPPLSDFRRICELLKTDPNHILGMGTMRALSDTEVSSARQKIHLLAQAAKAEAQEQVRSRGRLRRRSTATA
jgi:transcriptional regulator with XRE-family HTH domain